jgi:hypothetical protein
MAGLLDGYGIDPMAMGLLGAGGALLTPRQQGGGIGAALQAFPQGMMQGQEMQRRMRSDAQRQQALQQEMQMRQSELGMRQEAFGLKKDQYAAEQAAAQQRQDFHRKFIEFAAQKDPEIAILAGVDMKAAVERAFPKEEWRTFFGKDGRQTQGFVRPGQEPTPVGGSERKVQAFNLGDRLVFGDPLDQTGPLTMGQSPESKASTALGYAGVNATLRGQNMADARGRELAQLTAQGQAEERAFRAAAMQSDKTDKGVADLSNRLDQGKVPQVGASIRNLNGVLERYSPETVPGLGLAKNLPAANFFLSDDGKMVKSSAQAVANDLLSMYSGMAVTLPEAERRALESMSSGAFNAKDFYNAWPKIVERYNAVAGNVGAGFNDDVRARYSQRPGAMNLEPVTATKGKGAPSGNQTGLGTGSVTGTVGGSWSIKKVP